MVPVRSWEAKEELWGAKKKRMCGKRVREFNTLLQDFIFHWINGKLINERREVAITLRTSKSTNRMFIGV